MNLLRTIIISKRLKLIPTSELFVQDIFREFTPDLTTYMFPSPAKKPEDTLEFITSARENMKHHKELVVAIIKNDSGEFIGHGGVHSLNTDIPELGIWIKKSAHGNKYGREAVTALKQWLDQHYQYQYIKYPVDRRNIASRKIAESLGGIVKKEYKKINMSGNVLDEVEYWIYPKQ